MPSFINSNPVCYSTDAIVTYCVAFLRSFIAFCCICYCSLFWTLSLFGLAVMCCISNHFEVLLKNKSCYLLTTILSHDILSHVSIPAKLKLANCEVGCLYILYLLPYCVIVIALYCVCVNCRWCTGRLGDRFDCIHMFRVYHSFLICKRVFTKILCFWILRDICNTSASCRVLNKCNAVLCALS